MYPVVCISDAKTNQNEIEEKMFTLIVQFKTICQTKSNFTFVFSYKSGFSYFSMFGILYALGFIKTKCFLHASIHKIDTIGIFQLFALLYVDCKPSLNTTCVVVLHKKSHNHFTSFIQFIFHFQNSANLHLP